VSLKELPAEAGLLTDLRRIDLEGCHALHTPPPHIVRLGHDAVLHFLRDLAVSGSTPCHLIKLVLLGNEKAGKSSLSDSLVAGRPVMRADNDRTVGIDVRRWWLGSGQGQKTNQSDEELVANIYDAAGHRVYRASHRLFMSLAAFFLHVVRADMSEDQAAAAVLEWVEAVQQEAPGSVMGVVWTHVDLLQGDDARIRLQQAVLARVREESERQVRAIDDALRQAEAEFKFEEDAAWREKQALRSKELEALDQGLTEWQERGVHRANSTSIGRTTDALARLATLHHEMQELEEPKLVDTEQSVRDEAKARLRRLRQQRVRRPRILFSCGVSSKSGAGFDQLMQALTALMKDQRLFPHVGMKVPRSYAMLERLAQDGRLQASPPLPHGAAPAAALTRAPWENGLTRFVDENASAGLRALCAQPYVALRDLEEQADGVKGMDKEQLHRALQFLHATGSVLHYGSLTDPLYRNDGRAQPLHSVERAAMVQFVLRLGHDVQTCWENMWFVNAIVIWSSFVLLLKELPKTCEENGWFAETCNVYFRARPTGEIDLT
jgi:GTPase SAR1 family protein